MRIVYKIFFVLAVAAAFSACRNFKSFIEGETLAVVGDKRLVLSEVENIFPPGVAPDDSLILLESYVNMWVKQQLKIREAEQIFSASSADIEQMVKDYRNSLLTHKLDQYYIDNYIDTLITETEVAKYYNDRRSDFILDRAVVKGRIVKLPENYRQKAKLKELMPGQGDKYQDFHDMALKNNFPVSEFTAWTDFSEFTAELPANRQGGYAGMLKAKGVTEINAGNDLYYIYITDSREEGSVAPIEQVRRHIRQILFHQRRLDVLRKYEDSIYRAALDMELVDIRIN